MADLLSNLSNPLALAGLGLLVPIILLYLLKPKPKLVLFPSTMFIRFIEKNKRFTSFLQRFVHDPILLIQILIITVLVLALVNPFYNTREEVREDQSVVIIIDASASMQSTDVSPNRFSAAISKAREILRDLNVKDEVSIVLAENIPLTFSSMGTREDAVGTLNEASFSDTPSNLGDAVLLARDMLLSSERKKAIYVLSDFSPGGGFDVHLARKLAMMSSIRVEYVRVGSSGGNVGIVGLDVRRSLANNSELFTTASVRNYYPEEKNVTLEVRSGDRVLASENKAVASGDEGFFYFHPAITAAEQLISVNLVGGDELTVDDTAYAYVPAVRLNKVILLSSKQDHYLYVMLQSLHDSRKLDFNYTVPEEVDEFIPYDVIVLGNIPDQKEISPETFSLIKAQVASGATLVVLGTESLPQYLKDEHLSSIMPVDIIGEGSRESTVKVMEEHDMFNDVFLDNVMAKRYYNVNERDNQTRTIVGLNLFENPLISYRPFGKGYVAYMGINSEPEWSNLYYSSSFPILWNQMIKYFAKSRGMAAATSLRTGEYLELPSVMGIETPQGKRINSASIFLDRQGVYKVAYPDRTDQVPVNLLDPAESNTTVGSQDDVAEAEGFQVKYEEVDVKVELFRHLLGLMLVFLLIELVLYRRRGII
ncbi:MAG: VWA domain-containing protein [Candidatus Altiarchaeota archaeon]